MITCQLTGTKGKGVKAHIVPKAFYELPPQDEGPLRLMSNVDGTFPKKLPVGIYDDSIVTLEGEKIFAAWDDYAVKILIERWSNFIEVEAKGELIAWKLSEYNYSLLKLFALSVLWRAHASKQPAFSKVQLGPHEKIIRKMLISSDPGEAENYSVNIVRWISQDFGPVFMDPFFEKYKGINYYRVYCGRYVLYGVTPTFALKSAICQLAYHPTILNNILYLFDSRQFLSSFRRLSSATTAFDQVK